MTWRFVYTSHAQKDARKLAKSNLKEKAQSLLKLLEEGPFQSPPPFECGLITNERQEAISGGRLKGHRLTGS